MSTFFRYVEANKVDGEPKKMLVIGHRGSGMNVVQSSDQRMRAIRENSILSFEAATAFPVDFVEFDVQVGRGSQRIVFPVNVECAISVGKRIKSFYSCSRICLTIF